MEKEEKNQINLEIIENLFDATGKGTEYNVSIGKSQDSLNQSFLDFLNKNSQKYRLSFSSTYNEECKVDRHGIETIYDKEKFENVYSIESDYLFMDQLIDFCKSNNIKINYDKELLTKEMNDFILNTQKQINLT
jgi:hypothetical protein